MIMISETLNELIAALREELQQYGEMLARLDDQQDLIVKQAPEELLHSVSAIQEQAMVVQGARERRTGCFRSLLEQLGHPGGWGFFELIPQLPADYRPLLDALVQENNQLLTRVQQRTRQNHLLLSRSLESMRRVISALNPGMGTPTYNDSGALMQRSHAYQPLYQAVG